MIYVLRISPHNEDMLPYYSTNYEGLKKIAAWYLMELFPDIHEISDDHFRFEETPKVDFNEETVPVLIVDDPVDEGDTHKFYIGTIESID